MHYAYTMQLWTNGNTALMTVCAYVKLEKNQRYYDIKAHNVVISKLSSKLVSDMMLGQSAITSVSFYMKCI